jgi:hypothetical protein
LLRREVLVPARGALHDRVALVQVEVRAVCPVVPVKRQHGHPRPHAPTPLPRLASRAPAVPCMLCRRRRRGRRRRRRFRRRRRRRRGGLGATRREARRAVDGDNGVVLPRHGASRLSPEGDRGTRHTACPISTG